MSDRATTKILMQRLERHYIKPGDMPGGIFVPECGVNGSWGSGSRCDALYAGFTSTSGRILIGHEVKASRSDWLHELHQTGKADAWADQCHAWFVVATGTDVVEPDELPAGWGLLTMGGRSRTRLHVEVPAKIHTERTPSWDAVRSIMARLDTLQSQAMQDFRQAQNTLIEDRVSTEIERRASNNPASQQVIALQKQINRIQDCLGVQITDWRNGAAYEDDADQRPYATPERLGEALQLLEHLDTVTGGRHRLGLTRTIDVVAEAHQRLTELATQLDGFLESLPADKAAS